MRMHGSRNWVFQMAFRPEMDEERNSATKLQDGFLWRNHCQRKQLVIQGVQNGKPV